MKKFLNLFKPNNKKGGSEDVSIEEEQKGGIPDLPKDYNQTEDQ